MAGDSYARKSIFDALSQGAIPAIFHPLSFHYPLFHPQPYNNIVVLLDPADSPIDQLLRIPQSEIRRMQHNIRQHFHKFFYRDYRWSAPVVPYSSRGGSKKQREWPDAMETFLLHMCSLAAGDPMPPNYGKSNSLPHPGFPYTKNVNPRTKYSLVSPLPLRDPKKGGVPGRVLGQTASQSGGPGAVERGVPVRDDQPVAAGLREQWRED